MIRPFLVAFNKRVDTPVNTEEKLRIFIDGLEVYDAEDSETSSLLVTEEPRIELLLPGSVEMDPRARSDSSAEAKVELEHDGTRDVLALERDRPSIVNILSLKKESLEAEWRKALEAFNALEIELASNNFSERFGIERKNELIRAILRQLEDSAIGAWDLTTTAQAVRALRILSREAKHDADLKTDRTTLIAARLAGLSEDGVDWTDLKAEACLLLNNLLMIGGDRPAQLLKDGLGAEPRVLGENS